jgi:hypothetical protein
LRVVDRAVRGIDGHGNRLRFGVALVGVIERSVYRTPP